jgi:hypothetical protein
VNELTPADLAAAGLTSDDVTPELLAGLERTGRMLAEAPMPMPPPELVNRWDAALAALDARSAAAPAASGAVTSATPVTSASPVTSATPVTSASPASPTSSAASGTPSTPTDVRRSYTNPEDPAVHPAPAGPPNHPGDTDLTFPPDRFSQPTRLPDRPGATRRGHRSPGPSGRRARWLAGTVGLAATAAAAAAALVALPGVPVDQPSGPPGGDGRGQALRVRELPLGGRDYGPLADPGRLAGCLAHIGATGATGPRVLGARQVSWAGRPGVLLVLPTAVPGRLRVLVVSPDCGANAGSLLADTTVGS